MVGELRDRIAAHARPELTTPIDGLLLSRVTTAEPYHVLTEPLLIVMAQGGKRLLLGDQVFEYRSGQFLIVAAEKNSETSGGQRRHCRGPKARRR